MYNNNKSKFKYVHYVRFVTSDAQTEKLTITVYENDIIHSNGFD